MRAHSTNTRHDLHMQPRLCCMLYSGSGLSHLFLPCTVQVKSDCLVCAVLLCLVVCLTLLASFFLSSHLSLKHVYIHDCMYVMYVLLFCCFQEILADMGIKVMGDVIAILKHAKKV